MVTKPIDISSAEYCNKENACNNRDDIEGNAETDLLHEDEVNSLSLSPQPYVTPKQILNRSTASKISSNRHSVPEGSASTSNIQNIVTTPCASKSK